LDTWSYYFKQSKAKETGVPTYINNVIEKMRILFKENFPFLLEECKEIIATVDNNLVQSCINLFAVLFDELTDTHNLDKMSTLDADVACSMVLIFSFVWSAGANLHDNPKDNSRLRFSQHIKGKILKFFNGFPYEGEVYDYYIDFQKKEFRPWTELVKDFKYIEGMPYFSILVPTADTVKFKYVL
jgi:dynein heavy chain